MELTVASPDDIKNKARVDVTLDNVLQLVKDTLDNNVQWTKHDEVGSQTIYTTKVDELDYLIFSADAPDAALLFVSSPDTDVIMVPKVNAIGSLARAILGQQKAEGKDMAIAFNFPDDVKVACEQYLLYFAQFLKDVGVDATTQITHEAARTLFTVAPNDENMALEKIREALQIYLRLADNPVQVGVSDVLEVQRLAASVQFFQSQIALANVQLAAQAATIKAHQMSLKAQQEIISLREAQIENPSYRDAHSILGGRIKLEDAELPILPGISIGLPEIFRAVRKLITTKKNEVEADIESDDETHV